MSDVTLEDTYPKTPPQECLSGNEKLYNMCLDVFHVLPMHSFPLSLQPGEQKRSQSVKSRFSVSWGTNEVLLGHIWSNDQSHGLHRNHQPEATPQWSPRSFTVPIWLPVTFFVHRLKREMKRMHLLRVRAWKTFKRMLKCSSGVIFTAIFIV